MRFSMLKKYTFRTRLNAEPLTILDVRRVVEASAYLCLAPEQYILINMEDFNGRMDLQ